MKAPSIIEPVVSEKTMALLGERKYVFFVEPNSNKIEIKKDVERIYSVSVSDVNIIITKPKKKRRGRIVGHTSAKKKAIVTLAVDNDIEKIKKIF